MDWRHGFVGARATEEAENTEGAGKFPESKHRNITG